MNANCIFCQIVAGKIPSQILYQDEKVIAFRDIAPQAPTHLLIIPKRHIPSLAHLSQAESPLIGHMVNIANQLAKKEGIAESGYRLTINCGKQGGQLVPHLHIHLLGGRRLSDTLG
ncbi:histidine triad nucleotide-binding protein [Dehalococcoidales bacterium]|nr:histidine triad nucleotide-binding protein [Dehalococcoidales bacterium]MCL0094346.1 histidine triad nucleotide-binding protein [Dehalococcoidales bacterium]